MARLQNKAQRVAERAHVARRCTGGRMHEVEARGSQLGQLVQVGVKHAKARRRQPTLASSLLAPLAPSLLHFIPPASNSTLGHVFGPSHRHWHDYEERGASSFKRARRTGLGRLINQISRFLRWCLQIE